jgi:hypothetical protein
MLGTRHGAKTRRLGAIGGCEARTQGVFVSVEIRARLRTKHRAAERGQAVECFVSRRVQQVERAVKAHR